MRSWRLGRCCFGRFAILSVVLACGGGARGSGITADGVTVYERFNFDRELGGFRRSGNAIVETSDVAVAGKALLVRPRARWAGAEVSLDIRDSTDLKLVFMARGTDYPVVAVNVYDRVAGDNTTTHAARELSRDRWTPVLYHLDRFVYNSRGKTRVAAETDYSRLRFFGPEKPSRAARMSIDNLVIYRGHDRTPPDKVTGLTARALGRQVELEWLPAADNVAPMTYVVSRRAGGEGPFRKIAESPVPRWHDREAGTGAVEYRVLAVDFERNLGPWSEIVTANGAQPPSTFDVDNGLDRQNLGASLREIHARGAGRVRRGHVCLYGDSLTDAAVYPRRNEAALGIHSVSAQGFRSMRIRRGRARLGEVLELENPEFLMVLLGTNDLRSGMVPGSSDLAGLMDDMEAIAHEAHQRGVVVLFGTVPPRGFDDPESRPEAAFNMALRHLGSRIGVPVAPIFEDLQKAGDRRALLADDGVHWRPAAMEVAARAWAETLSEVEWFLRDR